MPKTFSIKTLGCKLNQYESSLIASRLTDRGWRAVPFGETADLVIINTCTVTDRSDKKCRSYIRQGARFAAGGRVIVTGCLAENRPEELAAMGEVLRVFGNTGREDLIAFAGEAAGIQEVRPLSAEGESPLPFFHTRGFLKIQDGCDGSCSYCVVPSVRGLPSSRPLPEIREHARRLAEAGCPELVLTGITIGKYLWEGRDLASLVRELLTLDGVFRIRITSLEPRHVTPALREVFSSERVCRHLHLPLQSGSDRILSLMNRPYSAAEYRRVVRDLKEQVPRLALGTDIIIGFPGETAADFGESLRLAEECEFSYVHQFTFSPRTGTPAASMEYGLSRGELEERGRRMRELSAAMGLAYRQGFVGEVLPSVIEKNRGGEGYTAVSDNYIKIHLPDTPGVAVQSGRIVPVLLREAGPEGNYGVVA